jgi:TadE-like protein
MAPRGWDGRRGQALTELALVSAVLILVLLGVIDLARVYQFQTALQQAAREGARYAVQYDGGSNSNPFMCEKKISGCPASGFTGQGGIKDVVDKVLTGAGLPASTMGTGCTGASAPYEAYSGKYPPAGTLDTPWLYICYNATNTSVTEEGAGAANQATPNTCGTTCGGFDMNVVLLMNFRLIVGAGPFGPSLQVSGHEHMRVQGS